MNNSQKKLKKKKDRERKSKDKVSKKRMILRKEAKDEKNKWKEERKKQAEVNKNMVTITNPEDLSYKEIREKLKHNLKILEMLEEQETAKKVPIIDQRNFGGSAGVTWTPNFPE